MPPERLVQEEKKVKPLMIAVVLCVLVLFVGATFLLIKNKGNETSDISDTGITGAATTTVKVETSSTKVAMPEAFADDKSIAERKETLLNLVAKSKTQTLSTQEKSYILQEFGGERTALYKFSNEELDSIIKALNH